MVLSSEFVNLPVNLKIFTLYLGFIYFNFNNYFNIILII